MTLYVILALITFTGSRKREAQRVLGDIIVRENEYKEILSALLGLLNEGVHIVAGQGTSIFYNSVMARMEQMEPADVVGRRFEDAFSHMDLESSTIYRALQAGASTVNQPQRYINASGKYIHTINTTIPVKDADGKLLAVIEVANDVTQLSELCDRLANHYRLQIPDVCKDSSNVPHLCVHPHLLLPQSHFDFSLLTYDCPPLFILNRVLLL